MTKHGRRPSPVFQLVVVAAVHNQRHWGRAALWWSNIASNSRLTDSQLESYSWNFSCKIFFAALFLTPFLLSIYTCLRYFDTYSPLMYREMRKSKNLVILLLNILISELVPITRFLYIDDAFKRNWIIFLWCQKNTKSSCYRPFLISKRVFLWMSKRELIIWVDIIIISYQSVALFLPWKNYQRLKKHYDVLTTYYS